MRTFIALSFIFFLSFSAVDAAAQITVSGGLKIKIARPKRDCKYGFGFCGGEGTTTVSGPVEIRNMAQGTVTIGGGVFKFEIDKKTGMTQATYDEHFKSGSVTLEEDIPLDQSLLDDLKYGGSFTLKKGTYAVKESNGKVILEIDGM